MGASYLELVDGSLVRIDNESLQTLQHHRWSRIGGRVISVKQPNFSQVLDLADCVGGAGVFAPDAGDYRKSALCRLAVTACADGHLCVGHSGPEV